VKQFIKIGSYEACDVVNINETNVDFDLASRTALAGSGERILGCAPTGPLARCNVLIGVTMDGDKLPPCIIYRGGNTPRSLIKHEGKDIEAREKYGYPEGQVYTVQAKAWMGEHAMMKLVYEVGMGSLHQGSSTRRMIHLYVAR
jgi:hypothetical protein